MQRHEACCSIADLAAGAGHAFHCAGTELLGSLDLALGKHLSSKALLLLRGICCETGHNFCYKTSILFQCVDFLYN